MAVDFNKILEETTQSDIDCRKAREVIENSHPEEMAKVNELRKLRNEYYDKAHELQKEIDSVYNKISGFDQFVGKVVKLEFSKIPEEVTEYHYLLVKSVERRSNGADLIGTMIYLSFVGDDRIDITYNTDYDTNFYFSEFETIQVVTPDEFNRVIGLAKSLLKEI